MHYAKKDALPVRKNAGLMDISGGEFFELLLCSAFMNFPETFGNWQIDLFWVKGIAAPMSFTDLFLSRHIALHIGRSGIEAPETSSSETALRLLTT